MAGAAGGATAGAAGARSEAEGPTHGDGYDRFVDWGKRLEREGPFFRRLFEEHAVRTVVDAGCGSGRHAVLFASWGLDVTGVDPDPDMLVRARDHASASGSAARFLEGGFGGLASLGLGPVDAVTCTGNALPHVEGLAGLRSALADFAAVLRAGGVLVLHLLNHDRLIAGRIPAMPPVVRDDGEGGTVVFLRLLGYPQGGISLDFVTMHRAAGASPDEEWETSSRRSVHTAMPSSVLVEELGAASFHDVSLFGDHTGRPFDPANDESVVVVGARA